MGSSPVGFTDLKAGRSSEAVVARLLRFWEARNVKKGGELMGVDMLLLDEKSTLMPASINVSRLNTFKHLLNNGALYAISGFDVTRSNPHFKLCESALSLRFTDQTSFREVLETKYSIPKEMFRFRSHDQLLALANTNSELPDIIGEVSSIKTVLNEETQLPHRVMVQIRLTSGGTVCLSAFDGLADKLDRKLQITGVEPKVILATTINPKSVGGRLFLNATSGTHFYFDDDVDATKAFSKELSGITSGDTNVAKYCRVQKLESVTIAELNQYILHSNAKPVEFLCTAEITAIQTKNGWSYISCSKCSRKLLRGTSTFTCTVCHDPDAVALIRYRVELVVSNKGDTAVFVAFDTDMTKLTNMSASDAAVITENDTPETITAIVGKTFTFQLKLTEYNFTSNHQAFTISRIYATSDAIPNANFANQMGANLPVIADANPPVDHREANIHFQIPQFIDSASTSNATVSDETLESEANPAKKARTD